MSTLSKTVKSTLEYRLPIRVLFFVEYRDAPIASHNILRRADFTFGNAMPLAIQPNGLS